MKKVRIARRGVFAELGQDDTLYLDDDETIIGVEIRNSRVVDVITVTPDTSDE